MAHIEIMTPEFRLKAIQMCLNPADAAEVQAAAGIPTSEAIRASIDSSDHSWVMFHEGEVFGVFGITESNGWGIPWMLTTDRLKEFNRQFLKGSLEVVAEWMKLHPYLMNYVDSRHITAIRWLKWLGFTLDDADHFLHDPTVPFKLFHNTGEKAS